MLALLPYLIAAAGGAALMGIALFASRRLLWAAPRNCPSRLWRSCSDIRAAVDTCDDSIYLVDRETMLFVDASVSACERTGYRYEELMRIGPLDLLKESREELIRSYDEVIAAATRGIRSESMAVSKDGRESFVELNRQAVHIDGRWIIVTISRDVTRRKAGRTRVAAVRAHVRGVERHQRSDHAGIHAGGFIPDAYARPRCAAAGCWLPASAQPERRSANARIMAAAGESAE